MKYFDLRESEDMQDSQNAQQWSSNIFPGPNENF